MKEVPIILVMWHGQHFLTPFIKPKHEHICAKVLISRHRDGEINAIAADRLGIGTIRGSGDHGGKFHRKGGVGAFREMLERSAGGLQHRAHRQRPQSGTGLRNGRRQARKPVGRLILPVAIATRRRIRNGVVGIAPRSICRSAVVLVLSGSR